MFSFWIRPELALLNEQPPVVRSRLISEALIRAMKDWRGWIFFVILVLPCVTVVPFLVVTSKSGWVTGIILGILPFGCLYILSWWIKWKLVPKHLRRLMVGHGIMICLQCGYDLRASSERCPECNTPFEKT